MGQIIVILIVILIAVQIHKNRKGQPQAKVRETVQSAKREGQEAVSTVEKPPALSPEELLQREIEELNKELRDRNAFHRRQAALRVLEIGPAAKVTIPALIELYSYTDYHEYYKDFPTWDKCLVAMGENAVPTLMETLDSGEKGLTHHMARVLGKMGEAGEPSIPALIDACQEEDPSTRAEAAAALGNLQAQEAVEVLVELTRDREYFVREQAVRSLRKLKAKDQQVIDALVCCLGDKWKEVRRLTYLCLEAYGADAVKGLIVGLRYDDPEVRRQCVYLLGQAKDERALDALLDKLRDPDEFMQYWVIKALANYEERVTMAIPILLEILENCSNLTLEPTVNCLVALGVPGSELLPGLYKCAQSDDARLRDKSLKYIARIDPGSPKAIESHIKRLTEWGWNEASEQLASFGEKAISALVDCLHAPDPRLRMGAIVTLEKMGETAHPVFSKLVHAISDSDLQVAASAMAALPKVNSDTSEVFSHLLPILQDTEAERRRAVLDVVGTLKAEALPVVPQLIRVLEDSDLDTAKSAFTALGQIKPPVQEVLPTFLQLLQDPQWQKRELVITTLERILSKHGFLDLHRSLEVPASAERGIQELLLAALQDGEPKVRKAAVTAAARMDLAGTPVKGALLSRLSDDNLDVRKMAMAAVGRWSLVEAIPALVEVFRENYLLDSHDMILGYQSVYVSSGDHDDIQETFRSPHEYLRQTAAESLVRISKGSMEGVVPALLEALTKEDYNSYELVPLLMKIVRSDTNNQIIPPLEQALKSSNLPVATEAAELLFRLDHRGNAAHKTVSRELLLRTMEESDNKELAVFINKLFVEEREAKEMDLDYLLNS